MKNMFKTRLIVSLMLPLVILGLFSLATNVRAATSVTKDSITWTFDGDYVVGQFISGDWYVVAPGGLQVTGISATGGEVLLGTMKNPTTGADQGYDTDIPEYDSALNVGLNLPLSLIVGDMIISTTDYQGSDEHLRIEQAAILTVLSSAPLAGSFRPGYCDTDRTIFNASDIDYGLLASLTPTASTPSLSVVADLVARPWIDHIGGWTGRYVHPNFNMDDYGREIANDVGTVALVANLNYSQVEKAPIVNGLTQIGIDFYSIVKAGGEWSANGGHATGRKLPILFAGTLLNDIDMKSIGQKSGDYALEGSFGNPPADYINFGEDDQTFYVTQDDVDCSHNVGCAWDPDDRGGTPTPYTSEMIGMPEWGIRHVYQPFRDNSLWTAVYRQSSNGGAWVGFVLAAHIMELKGLWNHDVLFDYYDRYVPISRGEVDPFGYTVPGEEAGSGPGAFFGEMWDTYRDNYGTVIRADVDQNSTINTTDAMLTLKNSLGLDMSGTSWQSSATTGDVDCNGSPNSTDAMLILRYSLGLSMNGTEWCIN